MMLGPTKVETKEKEVSGSMMLFFLFLGLMLGATLAWGIPYVI